MHNNFDQINFKYQETDTQTPSVKLMSIFLVLVFILVPLVEIVPDFDYNIVSSFSPTKYTCIVGWDFLEPLTFKEIK
ncbi:hypothetical protein [Polaribacter sp. R77954]|uniref:hypothetical protein n=1 Tax=Polaribacter sp. R77954 TaxID=3093870 RepID=UPI0037CA6FD0